MTQPINSYWCWAACLSKMIQGLNSYSFIGKKQCEIVGYYKMHKPLFDIPSFNNRDCCSRTTTISKGCNIGLNENDLETVFTRGGFNATEIIQLSTLSNFSSVKNLLIDNQSPIIIKTEKNRNAHMILITGYGESGSCQYVLAGDPAGNIGEEYVEFNEFLSATKIIRAWTSEVQKFNLKPDKILKSSITVIEKFIRDNRKKFKKESMSIPLNYLSHHNQSYIGFNIFRKDIDKNDLKDFIENLEEDFSTDKEETCRERIFRNLVRHRETNIITEKKLDNGDFKLRDFNICLFKDYATRIQIKKEFGNILVRPLAFPKNYILKEGWQSYSSFIAELKQPANPKISYFASEDNSRGAISELTITS